MRIAFVSSPFFDTSSDSRRAEAQVAELARQLVARGHEVTVYATGTSNVSGRLRYRFDRPAPMGHLLAMLRHQNFAWTDLRTSEVDIVHCHEPAALALAGELIERTVFTVFTSPTGELDEYLADYEDATIVATSESEWSKFSKTTIATAILAGLDPEAHAAGRGGSGNIALFTRNPAIIERVGAMCAPLGVGLDVLADVPDSLKNDLNARFPNVRVFATSPAPLRSEVLRYARALVFAEDVNPFDTLIVEAMLAGTPAVAVRGSVADEFIEPGLTGELAPDHASLPSAIEGAMALDRTACREHARNRWSSFRLAGDYERIFLARLKVLSDSGDASDDFSDASGPLRSGVDDTRESARVDATLVELPDATDDDDPTSPVDTKQSPH